MRIAQNVGMAVSKKKGIDTHFTHGEQKHGMIKKNLSKIVKVSQTELETDPWISESLSEPSSPGALSHLQ